MKIEIVKEEDGDETYPRAEEGTETEMRVNLLNQIGDNYYFGENLSPTANDLTMKIAEKIYSETLLGKFLRKIWIVTGVLEATRIRWRSTYLKELKDSKKEQRQVELENREYILQQMALRNTK